MARPDVVTKAAKMIFDHTDKEALTREINALGWTHESTNEFSGAWWIRNVEHQLEIMVIFGGPRKQASAFAWRKVGSLTRSRI